MILSIGIFLFSIFAFFGCGTTSRVSLQEGAASASPSAQMPHTAAVQFEPTHSPLSLQSPPNSDTERLQQLWQKRRAETALADYPVSPGDVLEITVPAMEEIVNRTVRVSGDGTIELPFIGIMQAAGLAEE
ncbi:MAG: hypothetical protein FJ147_05565 [Deltaproteobacteria bacterium]|nr:hypothetical protein [Deltaproteobacteria bacterium]